jgi:glycosyltransferase involved in cell wall biosynthesis
MRVLLIDVNCKSGSTGKIVYDLYTKLKEIGEESAVAYGRGHVISEPDIYKFSSNIEVKIHALLTRLTGWTGCFSPLATSKLLKLIKEYNPDVIHLHDLHGYFLNIKPLIKYIKKNNIKTIWTFHSEFMYTGKCGISFDCQKWKKGCGNCPYLHEYPSSILFDFTKYMFNEKKKMFNDFNNLTIVTPSKWLANRVQESFLKDKKVKIIYNGINTNVYYPKDFKQLKDKYNFTDKKIVLSVAPNIMSKIKGGKYVLELARKMKDYNIKFILIGIENLKQKFDDNVIAIGRIENQKELAQYYSMADVFLMCSQKETFSLTCAEALCCGTKVVGFKSGAPETVFSKPYAHFLEYGDIEALKNALLNAFSTILSPEKISEYGRSNFDKKQMFEQYLLLYRE